MLAWVLGACVGASGPPATEQADVAVVYWSRAEGDIEPCG